MNPWIGEPLAAAHRAELQRRAASRYCRDRFQQPPTTGTGRPARLRAWRVRLGEALIRSGSRLAGEAPARHPLRPAA